MEEVQTRRSVAIGRTRRRETLLLIQINNVWLYRILRDSYTQIVKPREIFVINDFFSNRSRNRKAFLRLRRTLPIIRFMSRGSRVILLDYEPENEGDLGKFVFSLFGLMSFFEKWFYNDKVRTRITRPLSPSSPTLQAIHENKQSQPDSNSTRQIPYFDEIWESIAQDVFAEKRDFLQWLITPNEAIDQQKPILLLAEGGDLDLIKQLLGRFEHGIMA